MRCRPYTRHKTRTSFSPISRYLFVQIYLEYSLHDHRICFSLSDHNWHSWKKRSHACSSTLVRCAVKEYIKSNISSLCSVAMLLLAHWSHLQKTCSSNTALPAPSHILQRCTCTQCGSFRRRTEILQALATLSDQTNVRYRFP